MDDALLVGRLERGGDLPGIPDRLFEGEGAVLQAGRDRLSFHQLHHQVVRPDVVKDTDVRMVQRRNRAGFALEAGVELLPNDFDGYGASQSCVDGPENLAHAALSELAFDSVGSQTRARSQFGESRILQQVWSILDCGPIEKKSTRRLYQERFHFAAQLGIRLRHQRGSRIGSPLASRVI